MAIRVQNRRGTEARWLEVDPILLDGEIAFVKDKNYIKIGDGIKTFSQLDAISGGAEEANNGASIITFKNIKDVATTEGEYEDTILLPKEIYYVASEKCFALKVGAVYYDTWGGDNPSTNYNTTTFGNIGGGVIGGGVLSDPSYPEDGPEVNAIDTPSRGVSGGVGIPGVASLLQCREDILFLNDADSKLYYFVDGTLTLVSEASSGDIGELPTNLLYFSETQPEEDCDIIGEIIDNTDSTRKDAAASANMARHLNEKIDIVNDDVETLTDDVYVIGADGAKIPKSFIEMWESVSYDETNKFNYDTRYFELNEEVNITYEEAKTIYQKTKFWGKEGLKSDFNTAFIGLRTFFFNMNGGSCTQMCDGNKALRRYAIPLSNLINSDNYMFRGNASLEFVSYTAPLASHDGTFQRCYKLHTANISRLRKSISFSDSPLLTRESGRFMIDNADNGYSFTITLHSDAYARLTQEDLDAATAKNITIVTP